jgi:hypothetical protein
MNQLGVIKLVFATGHRQNVYSLAAMKVDV